MTSKHEPLAHKVAIVTGAGQGLGDAQARLLADRGAAVFVTDVNTETGSAVAASIAAAGSQARFIRHDVASEGDWEEVVAQAVGQFGKVDILVNNAGIVEFAPIEEMPLSQFLRVMDVNVKGTFLGCKLILPAMRSAGGGSIINISSVSGMIASSVGYAAYATSKGAVRMLTKAVAMDYVKYGVRVNSVHPGGTATPLTQPFIDNPETLGLVIGRTPFARPGRPEEIAAAVAFLASDEASFMTGSEMVVDGGWLAS
jgi:NAD(P)-dependent dehydrogenase (short-subunit alcohol dehydrogenase family)